MNQIAQIKNIRANGPNGETGAIMISLDIDDPTATDAFVSEVAEQFKLHRMIAPPDTTMMLITIIGDLNADRFATKWCELQANDPVIKAFIDLMSVADVVQGTRDGRQLSRATLLGTG